MKGIIYWGKSTFSDMQYVAEMYNKGIVEKYNVQDNIVKTEKSIFTTVEHLISGNFVFLIASNNKLRYSWCSDIRFNYRDKTIFIPYLDYDEITVESNTTNEFIVHIDDKHVNIHYNFSLQSHSIMDRNAFVNSKVYFFDIYELKLYFLDLSEYMLIDNSFSINELYKYYVNASFINDSGRMKNCNLYSYIDSKVEDKLRSKNKLVKYRNYNEKLLDYSDIRVYDFLILETQFSFNFDLERDLSYSKRKYYFEAYLLLHNLCNDNFIESDYCEQYKKLGKTLRFMKYEEDNNGFTMFLKHYYKLDDNIEKLSYEHYN